MADYDGPLYSMSVQTVLTDPDWESNNHFVPVWTTAPSYSSVDGWVGGGGGPTTPEGDPIYGYGWGLSG